jgi:putative transposase
MGRAKRIQLPNALYHVGANGNDGRVIILDGFDCTRWVTLLHTAEEKHGWKVHIYCLLTTHFHLLIETSEPNLSAGMHWLNHVYAKSFNRRHNRRDHLFGKRFWDKLILTDEQLVATTRYVAMNPVKAGLCKRPEDWPWSNYGKLLRVALGQSSVLPAGIADVVAKGARLAARAGAAA